MIGGMANITIRAEGPPPGFDFLRREYVVSEDLRGLAVAAEDSDGRLCACRDGQRPIGLVPGDGWTAGQTVTFPDDFIFRTSFVFPSDVFGDDGLVFGGLDDTSN